MFRSWKLQTACSIVGLMVFIVNLTGCSAADGSYPLLPSGFADVTVPDVTLGGYVYLNQSVPIEITPDFTPVGLDKVSVDSMQVWAGADADSYGGLIDFQNQADAAKVVKLINSVKLPAWTMNNGKIIYAVNSTAGTWNTALKDAITRQKMVSAATKYPEIKTDFTCFPANPPLKPFAAGFLDLNSTLAESVANKLHISLSNYMSALKMAGISRICFVGYGAQAIEVSSKYLTLEYFNSLQLSAIVMGRSSYPDLVIAAAFEKAMIEAGFNKTTVNNVDIYAYSPTGINVLVAHKGNIIYAAVSQSNNNAQNLLLSCF